MRHNSTLPLSLFDPTLAFKGWMLAWEASFVISLRMMRMASGGALATREQNRILREKGRLPFDTAMLYRPTMAGADYMSAMLGHMHSKVRANRRRLTRT